MKNSGRARFNKLRGIIQILVKLNSFFPRSINLAFFAFFRNTSGKIGLLIRYILIRNLSKSCGENVSIHPGVFIFNTERISFGDNVSIHPMCYLDGYGGIAISNNVSIAHSTSILSVNHSWDEMDVPIKYNKLLLSPVCIQEDVWIACGCRILAGTTIHSRTIIAAGAVVRGSLTSHAIYGGVPCKLIKKID